MASRATPTPGRRRRAKRRRIEQRAEQAQRGARRAQPPLGEEEREPARRDGARAARARRGPTPRRSPRPWPTASAGIAEQRRPTSESAASAAQRARGCRDATRSTAPHAPPDASARARARGRRAARSASGRLLERAQPAGDPLRGDVRAGAQQRARARCARARRAPRARARRAAARAPRRIPAVAESSESAPRADTNARVSSKGMPSRTAPKRPATAARARAPRAAATRGSPRAGHAEARRAGREEAERTPRARALRAAARAPRARSRRAPTPACGRRSAGRPRASATAPTAIGFQSFASRPLFASAAAPPPTTSAARPTCAAVSVPGQVLGVRVPGPEAVALEQPIHLRRRGRELVGRAHQRHRHHAAAAEQLDQPVQHHVALRSCASIAQVRFLRPLVVVRRLLPAHQLDRRPAALAALLVRGLGAFLHRREQRVGVERVMLRVVDPADLRPLEDEEPAAALPPAPRSRAPSRSPGCR